MVCEGYHPRASTCWRSASRRVFTNAIVRSQKHILVVQTRLLNKWVIILTPVNVNLSPFRSRVAWLVTDVRKMFSLRATAEITICGSRLLFSISNAFIIRRRYHEVYQGMPGFDPDKKETVPPGRSLKAPASLMLFKCQGSASCPAGRAAPLLSRPARLVSPSNWFMVALYRKSVPLNRIYRPFGKIYGLIKRSLYEQTLDWGHKEGSKTGVSSWRLERKFSL